MTNGNVEGDLMQFLHLKEKVIVKLLVLRIAFRH